jgi:hypothetical protein
MGPPKIPDRERLLGVWEPLVGRPAALALFRGKWVLAVLPWAAVADFALVWIIYGISPSFDVRFAWLAGALGIGFAASGFFFLWQWHHEAGRALGVKITSRNAPPSDWNAYLAWCRRNGVRPLTERP